jgi:hypothetical protein
MWVGVGWQSAESCFIPRILTYLTERSLSIAQSPPRAVHSLYGEADNQADYRSKAIPATGFLCSTVRPITSGFEIPTSRCCWIPHLGTYARPCHSATLEAPTATTRMSTELTQHGQRREPARSALFQDLLSRSCWGLTVSGFRLSVAGAK